MKMLIKDLAIQLNVDRSTALRAIKKMEVKITKVKIPGTGSLMSAIDEKDIERVRQHFGLNTEILK